MERGGGKSSICSINCLVLFIFHFSLLKSFTLVPSCPSEEMAPNENPAKLTVGLVHVLPRILAANHVLDFFFLHVSPLVVCVLDEELVGTGAAFEAVLALGVGIG